MSEKPKPRITRLTVGKGKTVRPTEVEEWTKVYYEIELELNGADVEEARVAVEQKIDGWLREPDTTSIPDIDLGEINALPWTTYKDKKPAKQGQAGWILWEREGGVAHDLYGAIKRAAEKLVLGAYEYTLSGKEKQFIGRRPVKQK